jgi:hypothetical protein
LKGPVERDQVLLSVVLEMQTVGPVVAVFREVLKLGLEVPKASSEVVKVDDRQDDHQNLLQI